MDRSSIVGIFLIVIGILGGQYLEDGNILSLVQPAAFFIVVIGTIGAVALQSSANDFISAIKMFKWIFVPPSQDRGVLLNDLVAWSLLARKEGILKLEDVIDDTANHYIKNGLRLLVDGAPVDQLQDVLLNNIEILETRRKKAVKVWESAGGFAPTIGILGAVLGLIHVMENLGEPAKLGSGIAVAFVATVYGVGLANLLFIPVANKLKNLVSIEMETYEMLSVAFTSIANNENPRLLVERCNAYIK